MIRILIRLRFFCFRQNTSVVVMTKVCFFVVEVIQSTITMV